MAAEHRHESGRCIRGLPAGTALHAQAGSRTEREHGIARRKAGATRPGVYSAASAGVIAFTKALGKELAATGIHVNCVAPGPIDTDLITNLGSEVVESF